MAPKALPRILILSDLWGKRNTEWLSRYTNQLYNHFKITFKDSCELAGIISGNSDEETIHRQFVDGGIDRAVEMLNTDQSDYQAVLAFSVGGTIAWKAIIKGLKAQHFFAVSATRIRKENPVFPLFPHYYYGAEDQYIPNHRWFSEQANTPRLFDDQGHEFYRSAQSAEVICKDLIRASLSKFGPAV